MPSRYAGVDVTLLASPALADGDYLGPNDDYNVTFNREERIGVAESGLFDRDDVQVAYDGVFIAPTDLIMLFARREWRDLRERRVAMALRFSDGYAWSGDVELVDGAVVVEPDNQGERDALLTAWARSDALTLRTTKDVTYDWPLDGTARALEGLGECVDDHFAGPPDAPCGDAPTARDRCEPF